MIRYSSGNILDDPAQALVNPVNTVGVMGKGLALQFREAFPAMYAAYCEDCREGRVVLGHVTSFRLPGEPPRYVINFPTKQHWRDNSHLAFIIQGLVALQAEVLRLKITSLAVPALGCGLGGLTFEKVGPPLVRGLEKLAPECHVTLYVPADRSHGHPSHL